MELENLCDKTFIIAEISSNHCQDYSQAIKLIEEAKKSGADAVKFQTYTPDTMTINHNSDLFKIDHPHWGNQTLYELYRKAHTPWEWFKDLKKVSDDLGMLFFSTCFDKKSVDLLEDIGVTIHKVASFELTDLPLIEYASKTKKPLIISTGMGTISEIQAAVEVGRSNNVNDITLLKCTSCYPSDPYEINLKTIPHMRDLFRCGVGLSDHSLDIGVSVAAVAFGASVVEKHFTLSRDIISPDNFFSMEPLEFRSLVTNIRIAEKALGKVYYGISEKEEKSKIFRRSIFAVKNIRKGEVFSEKNIRIIRPESGLKPKYYPVVLGKKAKSDIYFGTPLNWGLIN